MQGRIAWVEYAKAIGILLVVYGHVARGVFNANLSIDEQQFRLIDSIIYSFHMPLFFFLSGLFFMNSMQKWGKGNFMRLKIGSIVYPYLLWSLIQGFIEVFLNSYTNRPINFSDVFALLYQPRAQFWFLYALIIIFALSLLLYYNNKKANNVLVFILAIFLFVFQHEIPTIFNLHFFNYYFIYFSFGVLFSSLIATDTLASNKALFITSCGFILGQYLFQLEHDYLMVYRNMLTLILVLMSIILVTSLSKRLVKIPISFLVIIGKNSFAIYLMHVIFGSGARIILINLFNIHDVTVHLIIGCIMGVALPILAAYAVNTYKIPFIFSIPTKNLFINKL